MYVTFLLVFKYPQLWHNTRSWFMGNRWTPCMDRLLGLTFI